MENCTELYVPDMEGDRHGNSLDWEHVTLYSNIEPCPMCSQAIIWRGMREGGRGEREGKEGREGEGRRGIGGRGEMERCREEYFPLLFFPLLFLSSCYYRSEEGSVWSTSICAGDREVLESIKDDFPRGGRQISSFCSLQVHSGTFGGHRGDDCV